MRHKKDDNGNYVIGGKASILSFCISLDFRTQEQCRDIMNDILSLDLNVYPEMEYSSTPSNTGEGIHTLEIGPYSWADNLIKFGEIIKKHDHQWPE